VLRWFDGHQNPRAWREIKFGEERLEIEKPTAATKRGKRVDVEIKHKSPSHLSKPTNASWTYSSQSFAYKQGL
jgi:hypothetical protein